MSFFEEAILGTCLGVILWVIVHAIKSVFGDYEERK